MFFLKLLRKYLLLQLTFVGLLSLLLVQCYSLKWNTAQSKTPSAPPQSIETLFNKLPNRTLVLSAKSPAYNYRYDIGEKDAAYGAKDSALVFSSLKIKLLEKTIEGKIFTDFCFKDNLGNQILVKDIDLLRLIPKIEGPKEFVHLEMLEKEYNRFGYTFRKEHKEFSINSSENCSKKVKEAIENSYRLALVNNCLSPGKWEMVLLSEVYDDFNNRLKDSINLNQNRIISHSWFQIPKPIYSALYLLKNPDKGLNLNIGYDSLSILGEQTKVDFEKIRTPLKRKLKTQLLEVGHQSNRKVTPLDIEQCYKKLFGLFLNDSAHTYSSILNTKVKLTQFQEEGFYRDTTIRSYDYSWMKYLDSVTINVIDDLPSETYVQVKLTGKWAPYEITLGNVDMALIDEQKRTGFLFGINTYPKSRRYNPVQNTIAYDPDFIPNEIKPYLLLTNKKTGNWVNNQYKGVEKVFLSYSSLERDVLDIYVLSYERITPVWMASVKLPRSFREMVRIKRNLYNY